jgi:CheY-like chemotaxis protein
MVAQLPPTPESDSGASKPPRILLLEDDREFQEILQECLETNAYEVVAVPNGADGVREIMAHEDFDVIVCDMMMPSLPGDMFYLAVERMRPHLCNRFIFITGFNGNPKVSEFIARIKGTMLPKPFHVDDLLDLICFVRVRTEIALPN